MILSRSTWCSFMSVVVWILIYSSVLSFSVTEVLYMPLNSWMLKQFEILFLQTYNKSKNLDMLLLCEEYLQLIFFSLQRSTAEHLLLLLFPTFHSITVNKKKGHELHNTSQVSLQLFNDKFYIEVWIESITQAHSLCCHG